MLPPTCTTGPNTHEHAQWDLPHTNLHNGTYHTRQETCNTNLGFLMRWSVMQHLARRLPKFQPRCAAFTVLYCCIMQYIYMYMYICICIYIFSYAYMHVCIYAYKHTCIHKRSYSTCFFLDYTHTPSSSPLSKTTAAPSNIAMYSHTYTHTHTSVNCRQQSHLEMRATPVLAAVSSRGWWREG